jgi:hypothetical protein
MRGPLCNSVVNILRLIIEEITTESTEDTENAVANKKPFCLESKCFYKIFSNRKLSLSMRRYCESGMSSAPLREVF